MAERNFDRRHFLTGLGAAGLAGALPAFGQSGFPTKQITAIAPFTPGGMTEVFFRPMWNLASAKLGQKVIVEYKPGASGGVAAAALGRTPADGYNLLHLYATLLQTPFLEDVAYHPLRDFTYIISMGDAIYGTVVAADSPYKTFNDLMAEGKRRPGALTYGVSGLGTGGHIMFEEISRAAGAEFRVIPYKGVDNLTALLGGHVDIAVGGTSWGPQVKAGKLRALSVFSRERLKNYADVPTVQELGFGSQEPMPFGIVGPAGMNPAVVRTLHDAIKSAIDSPEMQTIMDARDIPRLYMNSADYTRWVAKAFVERGETLKRMKLAIREPKL